MRPGAAIDWAKKLLHIAAVDWAAHKSCAVRSWIWAAVSDADDQIVVKKFGVATNFYTCKKLLRLVPSL